MQQRRDEILAKKAKLAELKRQRELRASQTSAGRQSMGSPGEVRLQASPPNIEILTAIYRSSYRQPPEDPTAAAKSNLS